jgi:hypothetical protein
MARIKLDPIFTGISGTLGGFVFKKSKNGETFVSMRPKKLNTKPSPAQLANRERFKLANAYAKAALADPTVRAIYEEIALEEGVSAYAAARDDYLKGNDLFSASSRTLRSIP